MWIIDFLSNRKQKVRLGNSCSGLLPVTSGVIQGSVMGPFLFNVFINKIDSTLEYSRILKYADDIRIFLSSSKNEHAIKDLQFKLQYDIDKITEWTAESGMSLNVNKCFHATFGKSSIERRYLIGNNIIPMHSSFKDLGVNVSTPLSFNKHVDVIVAKAYARLGLIYKLFHTKSPNSISRLYKSFVRPILEFSSLIWSPSTKYRVQKIERIQKRMCRMIPAMRDRSYKQQLALLGIQSLETRRTRYQLITLYKLQRRMTKINFDNLFTVVENKRTRGHQCTIASKHARNNYRLNFFTVSIINTWNMLTQEDIESPNLTVFKRKLQAFFSKHAMW